MKNLFNAGFGYGRVFPLKIKKLMNGTKNYFRFVAVEDSSILLSGMNEDIREPDNTIDLQYSKDGKSWTQYNFTAIPLTAGETLYMKGNNPNGFSIMDMENGGGRMYLFGNLFGEGNVTTGKYECHGNIMSLLYGDDFEDKTTIPSVGCFNILFIGCDGLLTAPELPATTLTDYCYDAMFQGCTSLVTAPELPATTLTERCYSNMFRSCDSLTKSPILPATTLVNICYYRMFEGCDSLNQITMLATDVSATDCLFNWVDSVASTGIFTKASSMTSLPTGADGIPEDWTVVDYTA